MFEFIQLLWLSFFLINAIQLRDLTEYHHYGNFYHHFFTVKCWSAVGLNPSAAQRCRRLMAGSIVATLVSEITNFLTACIVAKRYPSAHSATSDDICFLDGSGSGARRSPMTGIGIGDQLSSNVTSCDRPCCRLVKVFRIFPPCELTRIAGKFRAISARRTASSLLADYLT